MKFVCLGYLDVESWSKKTPAEQNAAIDACFSYDDVLRKAGHFAGGEALAGPDKVVTLWKKPMNCLLRMGLMRRLRNCWEAYSFSKPGTSNMQWS